LSDQDFSLWDGGFHQGRPLQILYYLELIPVVVHHDALDALISEAYFCYIS